MQSVLRQKCERRFPDNKDTFNAVKAVFSYISQPYRVTFSFLIKHALWYFPRLFAVSSQP